MNELVTLQELFHLMKRFKQTKPVSEHAAALDLEKTTSPALTALICDAQTSEHVAYRLIYALLQILEQETPR